MGLILDTSILIAAERRGQSIQQLFWQIQQIHRESEVAISAMTVIEVGHGLYRARTENERRRRLDFTTELYRDLSVQPLTLEIAQLAGQIEGEQAAIGNVIAVEDIIIGATALYLGYDVLTLNIRHFERIPNLRVLTL